MVVEKTAPKSASEGLTDGVGWVMVEDMAMKVGDVVRYSPHRIRRWCQNRIFSAEDFVKLKADRGTVIAINEDRYFSHIVRWDDGRHLSWAGLDLTVVG